MVYYLQQNVAILDQISRQVSSIAPQFPIPSTPPLSFPDFKPLASNIRVNAFWFMALVFSLSAALLATLVQQWVRDYMRAFQRYSDPLKSARLRQYLHEGWQGWHMPIVAEAVTALLHVSLFLFFVGLFDFVLNINTAIKLSTTIPIAITSFLYILATIARIFKPQSPYQNPISGFIWYIIQKFGVRRYKDRDSGELKFVSPDMAEGQMQLAMEETEDRKGRDERSIRWLVSSMTEDAEMESLVTAIPGSFDDKWGLEVWKKVLSSEETKNISGIQRVIGLVIRRVRPSSIKRTVNSIIRLVRPSSIKRIVGSVIRQVRPSSIKRIVGSVLRRVRRRANTAAPTPEETTKEKLNRHIGHLFDTCKNPGLLANKELWRKRTRACVESTASLVCCAGADIPNILRVSLEAGTPASRNGVFKTNFEDIVKVLGDIGDDQKVRELSLAGMETSFVIRWTFLSLVVIRQILESNSSTKCIAKFARKQLQRREDGGTIDNHGPTRLQKITETYKKVFECVNAISTALTRSKVLTQEEVTKRLDKCEDQISELEKINIDDDGIRLVDWSMRRVQDIVRRKTHGIITRQLPGTKSDDMAPDSVQLSEYVELFRRPHTLQFIFPVWNLKRIISVAHRLRAISKQTPEQWDANALQKMLETLTQVVRFSTRDNPLDRQLLRLQDLSEGGGLGFTVELFFLALKQLSSTCSSIEAHSALYIYTFRSITSDWSNYKNSTGTQELLLDLVVSNHNSISVVKYPADIVEVFLDFLDNMLRGKIVPRIEDVETQLESRMGVYPDNDPRRAQCSNALDVIRRARGSST
jgi:Family of unknown function (DUF6535)